MSVINTMLRNLDERRAGAARDIRLLDEVSVPAHRAPPPRRLLVLAPVLASAILAVMALYFWPRAEASARVEAVFTPAQPVALAVSVADVANAPQAPALQPVPQAPVEAVAQGEGSNAIEPAANLRGSMFVLATSMADAGDATASHRADKPARSAVAETSVTSPAPVPASRSIALPEPQRPPVLAEQHATVPATPGAAPVMESGSIRVEQSTQTPAERNQMEVQHAVELLQRGSLVEAEASLRGVLANDRSMLAARQTLFALLQRQQRFDEARALLKEGLLLAPTQASLLLPYARLLAARGEWGPAYEALAPASEALAQDAEYRGLCGVVLQRLGRFPQSVTEYRAAVKLAPAASAWWVGLGLSLEGDGRPGEARAAYLQARATSLGPELAQFVNNKLARVAATE